MIKENCTSCGLASAVGEMHDKLAKIDYLAEPEVKDTLRNIIKEREYAEMQKKKWTGRLKVIGIVVGILTSMAGLIYTLSRFFKGY